jgi:hypothetical protein
MWSERQQTYRGQRLRKNSLFPDNKLRRCLRKGYCTLLPLAVLLAGLPGHASAQAGQDQITIVIPAVQRGSADLKDTDAAWMSYIVGQSIKRYFVRPQGVHRSALLSIRLHQSQLWLRLTEHKSRYR